MFDCLSGKGESIIKISLLAGSRMLVSFARGFLLCRAVPTGIRTNSGLVISIRVFVISYIPFCSISPPFVLACLDSSFLLQNRCSSRSLACCLACLSLSAFAAVVSSISMAVPPWKRRLALCLDTGEPRGYLCPRCSLLGWMDHHV